MEIDLTKKLNLIQGDCLEVLKQLPDKSIDLILTDPPYGINYQSNRYKRIGSKFNLLQGDNKLTVPIEEFIRVLKPTGCALIFFSYKQRLIDSRIKNELIWVKNNWTAGDLNGDFGNQYESIAFIPNKEFKLTNGRPTNVFTFNRVPPTQLKHPTEKPVDLLSFLIDKTTQQGQVVLDCFMGSGTTGVASLKLGRRFVGVELDEGYFRIAEQRCNEWKNQERLLV
jgi:site-specific DNA-methyltransferase (adenine-specific)